MMIRRLRRKIRALCKAASRKSLLAYYPYAILLDGGFRREIRAVYHGCKTHSMNCGSDRGCEYRLRRNIHRIEKGLIMKPRKPSFALGYIEETVTDFLKLWRACSPVERRERLAWYRDVLDVYFKAVGDDPSLLRHRKHYEEAVSGGGACGEPLQSPSFRESADPNSVCYEDFFGLARIRRSVRWYLPKKVDRSLIDLALAAALQSPSACNRQPFRFEIFDEPERVKQIAALPMGTVGFNHQFPMIIVVIGMLEAYADERDRHVIYIDSALASMTFMLALETLGLSSCPINWPDVASRERRMAQELGLRPHERPVMLISVGHADPGGAIPFSAKKPLDQVRRFNPW